MPKRIPCASSGSSPMLYVPISPPRVRSAAAELGVVDLEQVAELLLLGAQVRDVLVVRLRAQRHPLDDLEAVALDTAVLRRVVRQQPHGRDTEVDEDLGTDAVLTRVDGEAELEVRLDGVATLLLELVRAQFVAEADAASFVAAQVDHDAFAGVVHALQRLFELLAAVAAHRA